MPGVMSFTSNRCVVRVSGSVVKAVATKHEPELDPQNPHNKKETTPTVYTQYLSTEACVHSHKINKIKKKENGDILELYPQ